MAARLAEYHTQFQAVRKSLQFAFNSTMMRDPTPHIQAIKPHEAADALFFSPKMYEISQNLSKGRIHLNMLKGDHAYNSPYGAWIQLIYPFSTQSELGFQYQRFSTGYLRHGKMLEIVDSLAADVGYRYLKGTGVEEKGTIVTICADNLLMRREVSSDEDLKLTVSEGLRIVVLPRGNREDNADSED